MTTKRPKTTPRPRRDAARAGSDSAKQEQLEPHREVPDEQFLTTDQGLRINDDQNSLKVAPRGPSLLEGFILREKITHFDHERIRERVVHARGGAAAASPPRWRTGWVSRCPLSATGC